MAYSDDVPEYMDGDEHYNSEIYRALSQENKERVVKLCKNIPEGPFHVISAQNDTVLHIASYYKQCDLVLELLAIMPQDQLEKMTHQNKRGNTILHEAVAFNKMIPAVDIMLKKGPLKLLSMHNNLGVTALYRAVRKGRDRMFVFLDREVHKRYQSSEEICEKFYQKKDKSSNILHAAVSAEEFGLALLIVTKYDSLVRQRNEYGMTALQLLASNSEAFRSRHRSYLRRLMYYFAPAKFDLDIPEEVALGWRLPSWWEAIKLEKRQQNLAMDLAQYLVEKDTSWKETNLEEEVEENGNSSSTSKKINETALFTATKSGCIDIVKMIIKEYPQTVEHIDNNGWNILHIAIKYRQLEVLDLVARMTFLMRRLIHMFDKKSNTILHMAADEGEKIGRKGKSQSPAIELLQNLILFEQIKNICVDSLIKQENAEGRTAEELFAKNNEKLREDAKKWLKSTAMNFSFVVVLIATVSITAAYTVPGGPDQTTGAPILLNHTLFVMFTITNVLSLTFTLISIMIFITILSSTFQLKNFKKTIPSQLGVGVLFMIFSVTMMLLTFAESISLMVHRLHQSTKFVFYLFAFLPVSFFALIYMPLYAGLVISVIFSFKKTLAFSPRYISKYRVSKTSNPPLPHSSLFFRMRCQCFQKILAKIWGFISRKPQITSSPNTSEIQATDSTPPHESQGARLPL